MADVIPVDGPIGPDVPYVRTFIKLFRNGCLVTHDRLQDGRMLQSRLDVTQINPAATELLGRTVYGPAILSRVEEPYGG